MKLDLLKEKNYILAVENECCIVGQEEEVTDLLVEICKTFVKKYGEDTLEMVVDIAEFECEKSNKKEG